MKLKLILTSVTLLFLGLNCAFSEEMPSFFKQIPQDDELCITSKYDDFVVFSELKLNTGEIIFKQNSKNISSIDPSLASSYYPGGRGPNKLIIYTPYFGLHTGTNEFGTEAIVEDNTVVAISGADSTIPKNGIVISGHGSAKNWITDNISVGSKIYVDATNNIITAYTTSESYMFEAKSKIAEAKSLVEYYQANLQNYNSDKPFEYIVKALGYLNKAEENVNNQANLTQYTQDAISSANMAIKTAVPYIENELKGTWIRPTEVTKEQIISTLDNLQTNGFNAVFLETYYHGKTIFPSKTMNKYGFTIQNQQFEGIDPLEIWISEAHKRGIKVHIWFQSFYVGNQAPELNPSSILSVRPDWGNKTKKYSSSPKATQSVSEHNGYFLDPANPEVQDFLLELIDEIITTYKPDGINLDYIRYPNATAGNDQNAWGFTEYARNDFKETSGIDPVELTTSDVLWYDWNQYRRNNVTSFVQKVGKLGKSKNTYISAVIFPDLASALSSKQQDWRSWSANEYIDGFTPLFLTYDPNMLESMMNDVERAKSPKTDLYAGLFITFMNGAPEDLIRQIHQVRKMNAGGIILFDYAHTTGVYTNTLMASVFDAGKTKHPIASSQKKKFFQKENEVEKIRLTNNNQNTNNTPPRVKVTTTKSGTWVFSKN